jgi:LPS export ABC transporter protein LptC
MKIPKIVSIITLCLLIFWFFKTSIFKNGKEAGSSKVVGEDMLTEKVQSFSLEGFSETGDKLWQIEGKSADIYSDVINLTDINADSYDREMKVNLTSETGVFDRKSNNIQLKENVVLTTSDGSRLTTHVLSWDADKEQVFTEEKVYIERGDINANGIGALASPNLKKAQLNKDVTVNVKNPEAVITCDGPLEIDYISNMAYFNKNVKLDDKKAKISTDKATAYFNPEERSLTKVLCEGDVEIVRGKDITHSERLIYMPSEGRVILEGRPQIAIGSAGEMLEEAK